MRGYSEDINKVERQVTLTFSESEAKIFKSALEALNWGESLVESQTDLLAVLLRMDVWS